MNPFEMIGDEELYKMCQGWNNRTLLNMAEAYKRVNIVCENIIENRKTESLRTNIYNGNIFLWKNNKIKLTIVQSIEDDDILIVTQLGHERLMENEPLIFPNIPMKTIITDDTFVTRTFQINRKDKNSINKIIAYLQSNNYGPRY